MLKRYEEMISEYLLNKYDNTLTKCGKFIEEFFQILDFIVRKKIASKPNLFNIEKRLERALQTQQIPSSLKWLIADSLRIGYRFRNSRDGAHVTDFIANKMDAKYVINISKWCIAEIIRIYSNLSTSECINLIDGIMEQPQSHIQKFDQNILVLHSTSAANEILIILYFIEEKKVVEDKIKNLIKLHSKSNITTSLNNLEKKRLIYRNDGICHLTNLGEAKIIKYLKKITN